MTLGEWEREFTIEPIKEPIAVPEPERELEPV